MKKKSHIVLAGIIILFIVCMTVVIHSAISNKNVNIKKTRTFEYNISGE